MPCSQDSKALSIVEVSQHYYPRFHWLTNAPPLPVLKNVNMTIEPGQIYALLGPSGCGKTSLIRCILGLDRPKQGSIKIFGAQPGRLHTHPSAGIGYMPQTSALYDSLTVSENLHLFARFYHMKDPEEKIQQLIKRLDLVGDRVAAKLSGGQQRRLSLGLTIIHEPPFIILDEPTVGIDPILQKEIWTHLVDLARSKNLSILFTTHYIEEARIADILGFLSPKGTFICQDSVPILLRRYGARSLNSLFHMVYDDYNASENKLDADTVALQLEAPSNSTESLIHSETNSSSGVSESSLEIVHSLPRSKRVPTKNVEMHTWSKGVFLKLWYLVLKDILGFFRVPHYVSFQLILPTIQAFLFCICIGGKIHHIPVSVYNGDVNNLTIDFLSSVNNETVILTHFSSQEEAFESVRQGVSSGALVIPTNYTESLNDRFFSLVDTEAVVFRQPTVKIYPDMSNLLVALSIYNAMNSAFQVVGGKYLSSLSLNPALLELPVQVAEPIYGSKNAMFRDYMCPGVLLSILFLASISLTAISLVTERKLGQLERCVVSGVPPSLILLGQLLSHLGVVILQVAFVLISTFTFFDMSFHGECLYIFMLCLAQSICGLSFGLLIAAFSDTELSALMFGLGFFYPSLLLSGTVWPVESMSEFLQYLTDYMPQTIAIRSLRHMIARGWGPDRPEVFEGFVSTIAHTIFYCVISCITFRVMKFKK